MITALWRTDRVNEMILVDMGHIELSTDQQDEHNFNTEAYIYGIYTPNIINPIEVLTPILIQGSVMCPGGWNFSAQVQASN